MPEVKRYAERMQKGFDKYLKGTGKDLNGSRKEQKALFFYSAVNDPLMVLQKPVSTIFSATSIIFLKALPLLMPWPIITGFATPSTGVPP